MSRLGRCALVTGGAGFIGTNVSDRLVAEGWRVRVLDDLSRPGVEANLDWLCRRHGAAIEVVSADVRDAGAVSRATQGAEAIFHFAAQVAVTTSLEEPLADADINIRGTLNVLEAARRQDRPPSVLFTSTNKVYGALDDVALSAGPAGYAPEDAQLRRGGVAETRPLQFCTPYGCSKGAADQYVIDWAHSYGVPTVVFRMSCIYGPHQCGTEDQGWVAHFLLSALAGQEIAIYGDGRQVRDILYVDDLVEAMLAVQARSATLGGAAFNVGGGPANAVSLRRVLELIAEARGGVAPAVRYADWRQGDQRYYVSDHGALSQAVGWTPRVGPREGITRLLEWLSDEGRATTLAARAATLSARAA